MSESRKSYSSEFKREAVRLADSSDKSDSEIEREMGLYQEAIRPWREDVPKPGSVSEWVLCMAQASSQQTAVGDRPSGFRDKGGVSGS